MGTPENASAWFKFDTQALKDYQKNCYAEAISLFGVDTNYIPIEFLESDIDYVFGEINKIKYTQAFDIRLFIEGWEELHEALKNYTKFGMMLIPETLEVKGSLQDYNDIVKDSNDKIIPPKSGDLIMFTLHGEQMVLEVTGAHLEYDSYYSFLAKLYNYDALTTLDTGIEDFDNIQDVLNPGVDENEKIEEQNDEYQDKSKSDGMWGEY